MLVLSVLLSLTIQPVILFTQVSYITVKAIVKEDEVFNDILSPAPGESRGDTQVLRG